eukprot:6887231-Pyramimonas_sp.AAC.1
MPSGASASSAGSPRSSSTGLGARPAPTAKQRFDSVSHVEAAREGRCIGDATRARAKRQNGWHPGAPCRCLGDAQTSLTRGARG